MADTFQNLPADLPVNWVNGQKVSAYGTEVGLTEKHGYNYLMLAVNNAQNAINLLAATMSNSNQALIDEFRPAIANLNTTIANLQTSLTSSINAVNSDLQASKTSINQSLSNLNTSVTNLSNNKVDKITHVNGSLNLIVTSGFYRLQEVSDGPPQFAVNYGQMIVSRGGDTIFQIVSSYQGRAAFRNGNPTNVGGNGPWNDWIEMTEGGIKVQASAPVGNMNHLWIPTTGNLPGVTHYWNGSAWTPCGTVWG